MMSIDETYIRTAATLYDRGEPITDLHAKIIANAWHGGMKSALYSFTSTGAIWLGVAPDGWNRNLHPEIASAIASCELQDGQSSDESALYALRRYVIYHGERGVQDGWSELVW